MEFNIAIKNQHVFMGFYSMDWNMYDFFQQATNLKSYVFYKGLKKNKNKIFG